MIPPILERRIKVP